MLMARLTPVSVVFSAVSLAYFLASVSSTPLDQTCSSQRTSVRSSPLIVSGTLAFPSSKRTSVIPGFRGMAVVVLTSADERLPRISRLRPSMTREREKPC